MATAGAAGTPAKEQQRRIERVDFSYEMLGALMGRRPRSDGSFALRPFLARWGPRRRRIKLRDLPVGATHVELRAADAREREVVRVDKLDEGDRDWEVRRVHPTHAITPKTFTADDDIVSMIALAGADGRPLSFGPRIRPVAPPTFVAGWNAARTQILLAGLPPGTTHLEVTSRIAAEVAEVQDMTGVKTDDKTWLDSSIEPRATHRVSPAQKHEDPVTVTALPGRRASAVVRFRG